MALHRYFQLREKVEELGGRGGPESIPQTQRAYRTWVNTQLRNANTAPGVASYLSPRVPGQQEHQPRKCQQSNKSVCAQTKPDFLLREGSSALPVSVAQHTPKCGRKPKGPGQQLAIFKAVGGGGRRVDGEKGGQIGDKHKIKGLIRLDIMQMTPTDI